MKSNLKVFKAASIAMLATMILASAIAPTSAQSWGRSYEPRRSVYRPYFNPPTQTQRDVHSDLAPGGGG
jgi:hypothetical protein